MSKRGVGLLLFVAFVIGLAASVQDFRFDVTTSQQHTSSTATERSIASIDASLANLRAAQIAYIAAGQGPDFWLKRATDLSTDIEGRLTNLQATTSSDEARTHYD